MTDAYALLRLPKRLWLEAEDVSARFLELSTEAHPDKVHRASTDDRARAQANYLELNQAQQILKDPRSRLRHWLEQTTGAAPAEVQQAPVDAVELFMRTAELMARLDRHTTALSRAGSALAKAQRVLDGTGLGTELESLTAELRERRESLYRSIRELDKELGLSTPPASPTASQIDQVRALHHALGYLDRWIRQLEARWAGLAGI